MGRSHHKTIKAKWIGSKEASPFCALVAAMLVLHILPGNNNPKVVKAHFFAVSSVSNQPHHHGFRPCSRARSTRMTEKKEESRTLEKKNRQNGPHGGGLCEREVLPEKQNILRPNVWEVTKRARPQGLSPQVCQNASRESRETSGQHHKTYTVRCEQNSALLEDSGPPLSLRPLFP